MMSFSNIWSNLKGLKKMLIIVSLGQLVSFSLAMATFTTSLFSNEVDAPISLCLSTYLALAVVNGSILLYRRHKLSGSWYWYALLGFIDVQANYLANKAFQFTSMTSITMLDSCTVAWVMLLAWIFMGAKYSRWQFMGVIICLGGLILVLLSDAEDTGGGSSQPLVGDFLIIAGTLFFAMSNVGEEICVKSGDGTEVLAMLGVFGVIVSIVEIAIFERKTLATMEWSTNLVKAYAGFTISDFGFYMLVPIVLKMSGSTLCNLFLLTSSMWVVAFRIFIYKEKVNWLYYLAFALVVFGSCMFSESGKEDDSKTDVENGNSVPEYYLLA